MSDKKEETGLVVLDNKAVAQVDAVAGQYETALESTAGKFGKALVTAEAIQKLRELITPPMIRGLMATMNTRLGFLTDKDPARSRDCKETYSPEVVRDCAIEAVLRGIPLVGNCINIIAGNMYVTKEGFTFKLKNMVTDLKIDFAVPTMLQGGATVNVRASWKVNGISDSMEADIPIKVNAYMGADAVLGKAERKIKARIYNRITGSELTEGEVDIETMKRADAATADPEPAPDAAVGKIGGQLRNPKPPATPKKTTGIPFAPETAPEPEPAPAPETAPEPEPSPEPPPERQPGDDDTDKVSDREMIAETQEYSPSRWKKIAKHHGVKENLNPNDTKELSDEDAHEIAEACRAGK